MSEKPASESKKSYRAQAKWLSGIFIRPKNTLFEISQQASGVWLLPLLVMSILAIAYAGVPTNNNTPVTPANLQQLDSGTLIMEMPLDGEEWPDNDSDSQLSSGSSNPFALLGGLGGVIRIWTSWGLLATVLYLSLTLSGGRTENLHLFNIVAWAGMPLALRDLVRIIAVKLTHTAILNPGLSGLAATSADGTALFTRAFFALMDIYLFWSLGLLVLGGKTVSGLNVRKSLKAVLIPVLLLLGIYALAGTGLKTLVGQITEGASFIEEF